MLAWDIIAYIALAVVMVLGLFVNLLGLPGLWLMVGSIGAYAWLTWPEYVGTGTLIAVVVLALAAEVVEFLAGAAGSAQAGGTKRSAVGAIVGGIIGALVLSVGLPVIGTVVGACVGAFAGAWGVEWLIRRDMEHSTRVGLGAAKGRLAGIVLKSVFGVAILVVGMLAALPTGRSAMVTSAPAPASAPVTQPATAP
jgi:hypothetical protein